ncbi:MAG: carbon storage regulator [Acidiferrobacteraceae bacterium]
MLILSRREKESLTIHLGAGVDPKTPVSELFTNGPLVVTVARVRGGTVRLGVIADPRFAVLRSELALFGTTEERGARGG